ncbi:MAG: hypothetical protein Q8P24_13355 [Desulfobacterales bacterium]|nr:hypothetical protein [Desulfobacterales bacterium]
MHRHILIFMTLVGLVAAGGCSTSYKATPLPFKAPSSYANAVTVRGAQVAAKAYSDADEAKEAFGFDIRNAGLMPVQVVFDNPTAYALEIVGQQSFLEDATGNFWPILDRNIAYERATKYAQTKQIFKEGAYQGLLGAAAGSLIGAAIGIVSGENVAAAAGKGAAVGAAGGGILGGVKGAQSDDARRAIMDDLRGKSLQNSPIEPRSLAHGFLFFPGEAKSAKRLRIQLMEKDTGKIHAVQFDL